MNFTVVDAKDGEAFPFSVVETAQRSDCARFETGRDLLGRDALDEAVVFQGHFVFFEQDVAEEHG